MPNRRYRIGIKLWEIAVRTPGALGIREIATPSLQAAHRAIGQHLQLAVLHSGEVLYPGATVRAASRRDSHDRRRPPPAHRNVQRLCTRRLQRAGDAAQSRDPAEAAVSFHAEAHRCRTPRANRRRPPEGVRRHAGLSSTPRRLRSRCPSSGRWATIVAAVSAVVPDHPTRARSSSSRPSIRRPARSEPRSAGTTRATRANTDGPETRARA